MYSAVKVNGQKLYDLARKGREVERPARDIIVHEMDLLDFDENAQKGTCGARSARAPMSAHWSMTLAKSWARWPCCSLSAPVRARMSWRSAIPCRV